MPAPAGPDIAVLGRSVVIGPGERPPAAWAGCDRVEVDAVTVDLAVEMHTAWRERRPLIVELTPGIGLDDPDTPPPEMVTGRAPWEWPVELILPGETLHHAVWANSVDGRDGRPPVWRWAVEAGHLLSLSAGPTTMTAQETVPDAESDLVLPGGGTAVCDGGPIDAGLSARVGRAVLHRVAIEHGSLTPLGRGAGPSHEMPPVALQLAADQLAAVSEPRGGARVIAPAGSGKTRVLTERARLMIAGWGLPPAALALVAYNVRAAGEMRDRLMDIPELRIRTLNALGLRLCGRSTTIEEREVRNLLSRMLPLPKRAESDPVAPWIEALSRVRLGLAHPDEVEAELADVSGLLGVAVDYRAELAESGNVDFDEQVVGAIERLLRDPAFRVRSQRFARVLLVDEFQDLTPAHLLLLRVLSGPAGAVFGVGDDDQTIYGYAGATPRWLVDFERWFPGSASHALEVNYRCPPEVVTSAANLLSHNRLRVPKTIRPAANGAGHEAPAVSVHPPVAPDDGDRRSGSGPRSALRPTSGPATRTADRVQDLMSAGSSPADIAVLGRVNASLVPVQVLLGHRGIPFSIRGERNFLARSGVRAALAWLRLATAAPGAIPPAAVQEAARRPKRGMSNGLIQLLGRSRRIEGLDGLVEWLDRKGSARDADKVQQFAADVALVRRAASRGDTASVLTAVRQRVGGGLDASAEALDSWSHGAIAAHMDDLEALTELAVLEPDPERFPQWLADRLATPSDARGVTVASIHSVKGREWPHVIVHHVTDGLIPHRLGADEEEERRVFHVALTRCSRSVSLVPGVPPSPFLEELSTAQDRPGPAPARRGRPARAARTGADAEARMAPSAQAAAEMLREWRAAKARHSGRPAYLIFDDRTLNEIATRLPTTEAGLLSVSGIGPVKLDQYGSDLIAIVEKAIDRSSPTAGPDA